nr:hypothetical protein [Rhodobacter sp. YIM 73028]
MAAAFVTRHVWRLGAVAREMEDQRITRAGFGSSGIECGHDLRPGCRADHDAPGQAGRIGGQHTYRPRGDAARDQCLGHQAHIIGWAPQIGIEQGMVANPGQHRAYLGKGRRGQKQGQDQAGCARQHGWAG